MRNNRLIPFFILLLSLCFQQAIAQDGNRKIHKVVVQMNTADTTEWSATLGNIRNLQKIWPNNLQVELVVHGKALDFLVKDKTHLAADIIAMSKEGIVFAACENSMRKHHIDKAQLLTQAITVPSGVGELVLKQEDGWSYLKSGVN
jgi:intracellular sulfur oxidation DsrE/DsrF family protein